jgi:hypothetical protein
MIADAPARLTLAERGRRIAERMPTPVRLRVLSALIVLTAALLGLIGGVGAAAAHAEVDAIGGRIAPDVLYAEQTRAALTAADHAAANGFLATSPELADPGPEYPTDIQTASRDLEQVAELNSAGGEASDQLQSIDALVVVYMGLVGQAQAHRQEGALGTAYLVYASTLLHDPDHGILARVDAIAGLGWAALARERSSPWLGASGLAITSAAGLLLLAALGVTQTFVRRRFHRRRSNRLLAATALALVLWGSTIADLVHTSRALAVAQDQALPRLVTLWRARALASDADRAQSLSLLTGTNGAGFERAFRSDTRELVDRPLTDRMVEDAAAGRVEFNGLLADELRGAGFPGERAAAVRALGAYRQFTAVDAAVRARAAAGDHDGAVALALGSRPGQLEASSTELDASLADAIRIDQGVFDQAMANAGAGASFLIPLGALVVALVALWGLEPRLAEYRT